MRLSLACLIVILLLFASESPAQETRSNLEIDQPGVIVAFIEFPQIYGDPTDRLAVSLRKELEKVSSGRAQNITFFNGRMDEFEGWIAKQHCRYATLIEITEHAWSIDHPFQIPFAFHIFRNNFKINSTVKLYRQGNIEPILMKDYSISIGGPRVYQIISQNRHDGGLAISHGRRIILENQAEEILISKVAKEIYKTMERFGG
jgi:hypothetical protein